MWHTCHFILIFWEIFHSPSKNPLLKSHALAQNHHIVTPLPSINKQLSLTQV